MGCDLASDVSPQSSSKGFDLMAIFTESSRWSQALQWLSSDTQETKSCCGEDMEVCNPNMSWCSSITFHSKYCTQITWVQDSDWLHLQFWPCMCHFTGRQLRDDLMTLLIAGHETTAAMLTWATALVCSSFGTWLGRVQYGVNQCTPYL